MTPPDTLYAVERLTITHTVHYEAAEYECTPLLDQLRDTVTSSVGGSGGGGRSKTGSILNVAALELYDLIDGQSRAWIRELTGDHRGDLADIITRLPAAIQASHANSLIDDDLRDRLDAMPAQWVAKIEDMFDPPHMKELTAPCPECGDRYVNDSDVQAAAVVIPVKRGRAVIAECRSCGAMWATETQLVELADGMGIDVDFVALRELVTGSNTPIE